MGAWRAPCSSSGPQPHEPILFDLGLKQSLKKMAIELTHLDDVCLQGPKADIEKALHRLWQPCKSSELGTATEKCEVWSPS